MGEETKNAQNEENSSSAQHDALDDQSQNNLVKQCDEYLEGWKRAKADLINYKKDEAKRVDAVIKFANENIISDMIDVLDAFDLALGTLQDDSKAQKGVYLIRTKLEDILKRYGLEKVAVAVGDQFDPSLHDAVASVESDKPSGTVTEEVECGYMLHGKLIRATRVKVAK